MTKKQLKEAAEQLRASLKKYPPVEMDASEHWRKSYEASPEGVMEVRYVAIINMFRPHYLGIDFLDRLIEEKIISPDTYEWYQEKKTEKGVKISIPAASQCSALFKYLYDNSWLQSDVTLGHIKMIAQMVFNVSFSLSTIKNATGKHAAFIKKVTLLSEEE